MAAYAGQPAAAYMGTPGAKPYTAPSAATDDGGAKVNA